MPSAPTLQLEHSALLKAQVPIVTVSSTFRKELIELYRHQSPLTSEAVFSRAHYSMAEAVRQAAIRSRRTAHLVDPTNYVDPASWGKIKFTEEVGQLMARHRLLKRIKDKIDTYARSKLPITSAITPPLLALTNSITTPIISLHYEAGNILAAHHHRIIQVLTDPHVRPQYLDPLPPISKTPPSKLSSTFSTLSDHLPHSNSPQSLTNNPAMKQSNNSSITFAVFDLQTKHELLHAAQSLGKQITPDQIIVTGPPIDPRITKLAKHRSRITLNRPIHIGITTGGLGTNLPEIKTVLHQLAPLVKPPSDRIKLFLYAGTHRDFRSFFEDFADSNNLRIGNLNDTSATLRILHEDSLIDANNNLIEYLFPWADVIITKPSGDMAYDTVAAGCVPLFLEPWGEWEQNIQNRFLKLSAAYDLSVEKAHKHLTYLITSNHLKKAQTKAINLPPLYRQGAKKIIHLHRQLSKRIAR